MGLLADWKPPPFVFEHPWLIHPFTKKGRLDYRRWQWDIELIIVSKIMPLVLIFLFLLHFFLSLNMTCLLFLRLHEDTVEFGQSAFRPSTYSDQFLVSFYLMYRDFYFSNKFMKMQNMFLCPVNCHGYGLSVGLRFWFLNLFTLGAL